MLAGKAGLAHHVLEGDVGGAGHRGIERATGRTVGITGGFEQHREIGALHHLVLVALVEHGETRRHIRLKRELLQQPCAERVDGLHLEAARRLQRAGEQLAGAHSQFRIDMRNAGVADRGSQRLVVERDPVAERGKYPLRHIGRGCLGKSDAENLFRRHIAEQQPDHPLHQHMGLARAGIGRDERGSRGIRGARLGGADGIRDVARRGYHSSIPRPPAADHSLMRARSS